MKCKKCDSRLEVIHRGNDIDGQRFTRPHIVHKKTARYIYVSKKSVRATENVCKSCREADGYDVSAYRIDREELETTGKTRNKTWGWWEGSFYLDPLGDEQAILEAKAKAERERRERAQVEFAEPIPDRFTHDANENLLECFAVLGLEAGCSRDDIIQAAKARGVNHHTPGDDPSNSEHIRQALRDCLRAYTEFRFPHMGQGEGEYVT